jgi:hypothetical protein
MTGIIDKITGNGNGAWVIIRSEIISADKTSTGDFNAIMIGAGFVSLDLD